MARTGVCLGAVNSYGRFPLAEIQLYFTIHMEKKIKEVVALSDVLQTVRMYWKRLIPYRVDWECQDHFDGKN